MFLKIDSLWKLPDGFHIDMLGMLMYIMYKKCLKISKGKESAYKSTDIFKRGFIPVSQFRVYEGAQPL